MNKEKQINLKKIILAFAVAVLVMFCIPAAAKTVHAAPKKVTLTVLHINGKTNSTYRKLSKTVDYGTLMVLPAVPQVKNYEGIGWALQPNAVKAKYPVGKKFYIKKDITIYSVYRKYPCALTFYNHKGQSTADFKALNMCVPVGYKVKLPKIPEVSGYQAVGWTTAKGKTTPLYKEGQKCTIKKSYKLYPVYKKITYYTVNFYSTEGKTNNTYKQLSKKVPANGVLTLPKVPARSGYVNFGWSTKKNSSTASKATQIRVKKDMNIFAVQKPGGVLTLCQQNGKLLKKYTLAKGSTVKMPSVANSQRHVFLGWSTKKGQSGKPVLEAGDKFKFSKNLTLYIVAYERAKEPDFNRAKVEKALSGALSKYKGVIFVGDSRTNRMRNALSTLGSSVTKNVTFICEEGSGLQWLMSTGYRELAKAMQKQAQIKSKKPTAIIFTHGGNDYFNYQAYIAYMKQLAPILQKQNCQLYYMSVNPVNSQTLANRGAYVRKDEDIRRFNELMQSYLFGKYEFIDVYNQLINYGFSTDSGNRYKPGDSGYDDGLHYSTRTYKRIYEYCLRYITYY